MKVNQRGLRVAANIVASVSLAIAAWVWGIYKVEAMVIDSQEREAARVVAAQELSLQVECLAYNVAESAWINGEPYCLVHQHRSQFYPTMAGAEIWELEIVAPVPLADMPQLTGIMDGGK